LPRKKKAATASGPLFAAKTTTAPCVPAIREKVDQWRAADYPEASDTTRRLLHYWFHTDHRLADGRKFKYHPFQQQAVETLVYLYEVAKVRRQKQLMEAYAHRQDLRLLQYDDFARYCVKMATGSDKTKVMALTIAWQYFEELQPELLNAGRRLSGTPKFPWSRPTVAAARCVFNLVPCDNKFELGFAQFLRDADDVARFAKLPDKFGFAIEYTDARGNLRYYEPDFVAVTADGTHYPIETKGREDIDVAHKDRAARLWCENATLLTGTAWTYVKVAQAEYASLQPTRFADLLVLPTG
jgi:hypothetical protein